MSVENVTKFYNEVMKDEQLKEKLKDVNEKTITEEIFKSRVLPEAKAKGYSFTYADVKEYYKKQGGKTELDMDDMEAVSGGCGGGGDDDAKKYKSAEVVRNNNCSYSGGFTPRSTDTNPICGNCVYCKYYQGDHWYCSLKLD